MACRFAEGAGAGFVLLSLLLPGPFLPAAAETVVPTHRLIGILDGKRIELGEVRFTLQQALTPDIGLDQADVAELARKYFGTDKPTLKLGFKPQPGSRHAGHFYDKAPIAVITITFGDAGPDKPLSLAAEQVRNLSLGTAGLCDLFQGNPVHIGTGNKYQAETLFTVVSPGRPFAFTLSYNSQYQGPAPAGHGWRHAFSARLEYDAAAGRATVRRDDGKRLSFEGRYTGASDPWQAQGARPDRLLFPDDAHIIWRDGTGTRHRFDAAGRLTRIESPAGRGQDLEYDARGRLVAIADDFGAKVRLAYDGSGRLLTVTDPAGGSWRLSHDGKGNLTALARPDGSVRRYRYADARHPHHLTGIVDAEGRPYAHFAYDDKGRAIATWHGEGDERTDLIQITYTDTGERVVNDTRYHLRLIEGHWTITEVARTEAKEAGPKDAAARPHTCSGILKREYYPDGHLARTTDETGRVTAYAAYDAEGRPGEIIQAPATDAQRITRIQYEPFSGRPARVTRPAPAGSQVTEITYDAHGNPLSLLLRGHTPDGRAVRREFRARYDKLDRPIRLDGPLPGNADTVHYDYYPDTPQAGDNRAQLKALTAPDGTIARFLQYDAFGRPLEIVHPGGLTETRTYNLLGQLTHRTLTDAQGNTRTETRQYDKSGLLVAQTAPDGTSTTYRYTSARKLRAITAPDGTVTSFSYDEQGRAIETATAGALTRTTYDHHDRPTQITLPDHATLGYAYDMAGRLTQITDPKGRTTKLEYDRLGRIQQLTDPAGHKVTLAYDPLDDLIALTDTIGARTTFTHDGLGQTRAENSPDRGTLAYDYDTAGNPVSITDATGRQTTTRYDVMGRPITVTHAHEGRKLTVSYTYGKTGGALGKVTRIQEPTATQTYAYTPFGDLKGYTQAITKGPTATLTWEYDEAGRPLTQGLPGGEVLRYTYDKAGRTTSLTLDGKPLLTNIQYHHSGQIQKATFGNGLPYQATFDAMGRMTTQTRGKKTVAYRYDKAGNLTRQGKATYHYDKLDRLIGATKIRLPGNLGKGTLRYAYDANGNRTKQRIGKTAHTYRYAKGSNRLIAIDGQPLRYDAAGRLITDGHFSYRYGVLGRLATVTDNSGTIASYAYNEKGLRVRKTTHPGTTQETTTWFAYDPQGHMVAEYAATHNDEPRMTREYLWLGDTPIALIDHASTASDIYFVTVQTPPFFPRLPSRHNLLLYLSTGAGYEQATQQERVAGTDRRAGSEWPEPEGLL